MPTREQRQTTGEMVEAAIDQMTATDGDAVARATFMQLQHAGWTESEARGEIGRCFLCVWLEWRENFLERFHDVLQRVQAGESAAEIWPERWPEHTAS